MSGREPTGDRWGVVRVPERDANQLAADVRARLPSAGAVEAHDALDELVTRVGVTFPAGELERQRARAVAAEALVGTLQAEIAEDEQEIEALRTQVIADLEAQVGTLQQERDDMNRMSLTFEGRFAQLQSERDTAIQCLSGSQTALAKEHERAVAAEDALAEATLERNDARAQEAALIHSRDKAEAALAEALTLEAQTARQRDSFASALATTRQALANIALYRRCLRFDVTPCLERPEIDEHDRCPLCDVLAVAGGDTNELPRPFGRSREDYPA